MYQYKVTIFTPTYNRAYILEKLYRSIQRQTFRDFEWLIVDDSSTDETEKLVRGWMEENNDFPIRYYKQENGGKCRAINHALDLARGELFLTIDSDDYLTKNAVEKVAMWENNLPEDGNFCAVAGNLGTGEEETPNSLIVEGHFDGNLLDRYGVIDGERAIAFYTEIHRQYKYPEYGDEKFMTEAVAWNRMANDGYKVRFYNDIICIYEYREDGLTKAGTKIFMNNPEGYGLWLRERADFLGYSFGQKMKIWYAYYCDLSMCDDAHRVTNKDCARYIGAPAAAIYAAATIHRLIRFLRRKKR